MPSLTESQRLRGIELSLIRQVIQAAPPDVINLALGELGFPLPEILRQHALELLQTATPVYTPNAGIPKLREAIASLYPGANPEQVCVTNGAEEAVFLSLLALLDPGDTLAVPDPDYSAYPAIGKMLECNLIRLPFESDLSSVDWELWEKLLADKVKVLVFSHPSNPAGHIFSESEITRLASLCARYRVTLVVDEIYRELYFSARPASLYGALENLLVVGGLTKSHCMSGWRLGWALAPAELTPSLIKARQYVSTCSHWLSQHLAAFALSPEGMTAVDGVRAQLRACRELALNALEPHRARILAPDASPYLMLRVDGDDVKFCSHLAARCVICVPGSAFGDISAGWLRLNYAVPLAQLGQAMDIVCHELSLH